VVAGAAVVGGLVLGPMPLPAWAVTVAIKPSATADVFFDLTTCTETLDVITSASFTPVAREDEVIVSWTGSIPVLGKTDSHSFSGGTTSDYFAFTFPVSGRFVPAGASVTPTADWSAHNGNALSMGHASATGPAVPLTGSSSVSITKMTNAAKCATESQANDEFATAAALRATASKIRATNPMTARWDDAQAAAHESLARSLHHLAQDPPDPNYTTLPTATAPSVDAIAAGEGISAGTAQTLNTMSNHLADAAGQARAALTAIERAQGAHLAGDSNWERQQSLAAAGFLNALATRLGGLPADSQAAAAGLRSDGSPLPAISDADRGAVVDGYLSAGPDNADWLRQQGLTDADLTQIGADLGVAASLETTTTQTLADTFADPAHATHTNDTVAALRNSAATLTANPLVNLSGDATPSPTDTTAGPQPSPSADSSPSAAAGDGLPVDNMLNNGGFEQPALETGTLYQTLDAGKSPGLTGWTIGKGSVDLVSAGGQAATGSQFIDLNGNDTADQAGVISQKAAVVAGHRYRLSFQLAGNPNGDPAVKKVQASVADQQQTFTFDTTGHTNAKLGWVTDSLEACATNSSLTVTFTSLTQGIRGPNLDSVVLADVGSCGGTGWPWWVIALIIVVVLVAVALVVLYVRRRRGSATPTQPA
jgi:choice-of-anchor C domain-containing protein